MDWVLIFVLAGVTLAAILAIVAAIAAGGSDRASEGTEGERVAIWQAGLAPRDLQLLAALSARARVELAAAQVEVVLWRDDHGIVVTGSRLPPGRFGTTVALGEGLAGRALAVAGSAVAGVGNEAARGQGLLAIAAPIPAGDGIAGVIAATADGLFGAGDVARLEALAAEAGRRLAVDASGIRHAG